MNLARPRRAAPEEADGAPVEDGSSSAVGPVRQDPDAQPSSPPRAGLRRWIGWMRPGLLEWLLILGAMALMTVSVLAGTRQRMVNADDVALQNILASWAQGGDRHAFVGSDNFLLHFPLYWLTEAIGSPVRRFQVQVVVCNLICLLGQVVLLRQLARFRRWTGCRRLTVGYLPILAWAAIALVPFSPEDPSAGYFQFISQLNVNLRHLETGVWLILVVVILNSLSGGHSRPVRPVRLLVGSIGWVLGAIAMGLLFFSDPLFVYIGGGSLMLIIVWAWMRRRVSWIGLGFHGAMVLGALVVMKGVTPLAQARGLQPVALASEAFIPSDRLLGNSTLTVMGMFSQVHGNFFGLELGEPATPRILINAAFGGLLVLGVILGLRRSPSSRLSSRELVAAMLLVSIAALTLTPNGGAAINYRYLYVGVVAAVPGLGAVLAGGVRRQPRPTGLVAILLAAVIAVNLTASVHSFATPDSSSTRTRAIAEAVQAEGVTKGYASYWSANPISFYSGRRVITVGLGCSEARLARYDWLITRADLERPADRTFVVVEHPEKERYWDMSCLDRAQLPRPTKTVRIDDRTEVRFYSGDVGQQWPTYLIGTPR